MKKKILIGLGMVLTVVILTVVIIFLAKTYGGHPSMPGPREGFNLIARGLK